MLNRCRRMPVEGEVLCRVGDTVEPMDLVARASRPGPVHPVNIAAILGVPRTSVTSLATVSEGDQVKKGDVLARGSMLFGMLKPVARAPFGGVIESISAVSGQMMLRSVPSPLELRAYLGGKIVAVEQGLGVDIEGASSLVQGIFGIGSETYGELSVVGSDAGDSSAGAAIGNEHQGRILVLDGRVDAETILRAREVGAAGLIAASAHGADLVRISGTELNLAATGDENIGLTLVLLEGFGDLAMSRRAYEILKALEGSRVSVNGATQVRAGVVRPEVLGRALDPTEQRDSRSAMVEEGTLVRVVRGTRFGQQGTVVAIPSRPVVVGSGSTALVYEVKLGDGSRVVVPRANVEI